MSYLVDFERAIENHDAPSALRLWEEYTSTDEVDAEDLRSILEAVKASELREYIGRHVERALPLWEKIPQGELADDVFRLFIDLEITNSDLLFELTLDLLQRKFGEDPQFNEKMRLIGLRGERGSFRGCISNFILLNHMVPGNFVFHTLGWGVGEIMEVSLLREQLTLEFDYAPGAREMTFQVAFETLIPIPNDHFLAKRFGNPDALEKEAKKDPVGVIRSLLKDLGPKTASDIKDELCELVIPEEDWNRWWQTARAKVKKDTRIESPSSLKLPFRLLKEEISHEERLKKALETKPDAEALILMVHTFMKDFPEALKNASFRDTLLEKLRELLSFNEITEPQELQIHFFLQDLLGEKKYPPIQELLKKTERIQELVHDIALPPFKKRILQEIKACRDDWLPLFLSLFFVVDYNPMRETIVQALSKHEDELRKKLKELIAQPTLAPDLLIWYFQKTLASSSIPYADAEGRALLFEAFLILLSSIENLPDRRDLIKKMHTILTNGRYEIVRKIFKDSTADQVKEFILLATKCHSLSEQDQGIFQSLAEVAHSSLAKESANEKEEDVIWTTQEGYEKLKARIEHIGTVETVDNAKEIEVARAHGDLRENAEFKAALERRDRLQGELKLLSDQLNKSRVLSSGDIGTSAVQVGVTVECKDDNGKAIAFTLLGPWDADTEHNILSFQSKLAQSMKGLEVGDTFEHQGKTLTITDIKKAI